MVEESETTIYLPGGVKLTTESDETKYSLTDHLGSTRLAIASDNAISKPTDYTPFGNSPTNATTETAKAGRYTGQAYEPESATYDYHARAYDPSVARFTSPDAIRQSISPYSYTENNPVVFWDRTGNGRVPFFINTGMETDSTPYRASCRLRKKLAGLYDPKSKTRFFDSDGIFTDIVPPGSTTGLNREIHKLASIITEKDADMTFNNKLFWFVGDDKKMSETSKNNLESVINGLKSVKNDLAENIILFDFSTKNDRSNLKTVKGALKKMNLPFEVIKRIYPGPKGGNIYQFGDKYYDSADNLVADIDQSLKQPSGIPETTTPSQTITVQADLSTESDLIRPPSRGSARPHPYKRKTPRQPERLFTQNDSEVSGRRSLYYIKEPPRLRASFTEGDIALIDLGI